jgi:Transposase DDE domain
VYFNTLNNQEELMSRQPHHTTPPLSQQLSQTLEHDWQAVVERLPEDYEQQAEHLRALVRQRELRCASDLLRGLLASVLCVTSLRHLGCWAVLIGLCNISETAWRKRLRKSRAWLLWLLAALLAGPALPDLPASPQAGRRVLLIDATRLKAPGGSGDDWRLHTAYDLRAGRLVQVSLSDRHGAEALERFVLSAGEIVVADAGSGYRRAVVWVLSQQAEVVVRIHPSAFPLLDEQGEPLDVVAWLKHMHAGQHSRLARFVWQGQSYQVRLLACALSPQAAQRAREAKRKKASKMQRELKEQTLFLAGWVLLVSTLPQEQWSTQQVLALSRARWQTELLSKRMKQVLRLNQVRCIHLQAAEATILALLVAWALQEQEAEQARAVLAQAADCWYHQPPAAEPATEPPISRWLLTAVCVQTLRQVTPGYWTLARLRVCLPYQQRFFRGSPRKRQQQESVIRALLSELLRPDPSLDEAFFSCSSA